MSGDVSAFIKERKATIAKQRENALAALLAALDRSKPDIDAAILATEPGKTAIGLGEDDFRDVFQATSVCKDAFGLEFLPFYNAVRGWARRQYGEEITVDFTYIPRLILRW